MLATQRRPTGKEPQPKQIVVTCWDPEVQVPLETALNDARFDRPARTAFLEILSRKVSGLLSYARRNGDFLRPVAGNPLFDTADGLLLQEPYRSLILAIQPALKKAQQGDPDERDALIHCLRGQL